MTAPPLLLGLTVESTGFIVTVSLTQHFDLSISSTGAADKSGYSITSFGNHFVIGTVCKTVLKGSPITD
jgi:hypothetical protein